MSRSFVSEPIRPVATDTVDAAALGAGEPSLPASFRWRDQEATVIRVLESSRGLRVEGFSGETYLRRHEWKLQMDDGSIWEVYFERQGKKSRRNQPRWFLKSVERPAGPEREGPGQPPDPNGPGESEPE
ncbi:MAG: hypothetical protein DHS20C21_11890 [Gemmatimonadota bacterium]|nr:MAG: hypothetical protein DHS20C21_11890 [Gemmatimonadota bacterium]